MRYHLIALFTVFAWGLTFVSTKVLLNNFTPLWILLIRFVIGFICLCILRPHILKLRDRKHEWLFVLAGATGIAAYYLLENIALVFTTATAVGVIVAASPIFTTILLALLGVKGALNVRFFIGSLLAMGGLVLVGIGSDLEGILGGMASVEALAGDGMALAAGLVWAVYSITIKRISDLGYETIAVTKRTFIWGLVFMIPAAILFGGEAPSLEVLGQPVNIANLAFLGVVASAACFATWGIAVKDLGPIMSTTYIYLVPAITAVASIIMLGEPLSAFIVMGIVLTIAGLNVTTLAERP